MGPEVGPASAFFSCIPTGTSCNVWANLAPFSLPPVLLLLLLAAAGCVGRAGAGAAVGGRAHPAVPRRARGGAVAGPRGGAAGPPPPSRRGEHLAKCRSSTVGATHLLSEAGRLSRCCPQPAEPPPAAFGRARTGFAWSSTRQRAGGSTATSSAPRRPRSARPPARRLLLLRLLPRAAAAAAHPPAVPPVTAHGSFHPADRPAADTSLAPRAMRRCRTAPHAPPQVQDRATRAAGAGPRRTRRPRRAAAPPRAEGVAWAQGWG